MSRSVFVVVTSHYVSRTKNKVFVAAAVSLKFIAVFPESSTGSQSLNANFLFNLNDL